MNIIQNNIQLSNANKTYILKAFKPVERVADIDSATVSIKKRQNGSFRSRFVLKDTVCEENASTFFEAVDLLVDSAKRSLRKSKEKKEFTHKATYGVS